MDSHPTLPSGSTSTSPGTWLLPGHVALAETRLTSWHQACCCCELRLLPSRDNIGAQKSALRNSGDFSLTAKISSRSWQFVSHYYQKDREKATGAFSRRHCSNTGTNIDKEMGRWTLFISSCEKTSPATAFSHRPCNGGTGVTHRLFDNEKVMVKEVK